jgi:hypothetical protein
VDYFQLLCRNFLDGLNKSMEKCHDSPDIRFTVRDLNQAVPQALSLDPQCRILLSAVVQSVIKRRYVLAPESIIVLFVRRRNKHREVLHILSLLGAFTKLRKATC